MSSRPGAAVPLPGPEAGRRPRSSIIWVQGLACGAVLTFAAPTALLLAVLFAPAVVCLLAESAARRTITHAVALGCAAASLGPAWRLWMAGDGMDQALATLSNPTTVTLAWGAGACAWALCQVLPVIISKTQGARDAARMRAIQAEIDACRASWNLEAE